MRSTIFLIGIIVLILISPSIAMTLTGYGSNGAFDTTTSVVAPLLIFLLPVAIFRRNIKWYLWLLCPVVVLTPLFIFATWNFGVPPGFQLIAFVLQTNMREATEAIIPFLIYFIPFQILFVIAYVAAVRAISSSEIPFRVGWSLSIFSLVLLAVITIHNNDLYHKPITHISKHDLILKYKYPVSLLSGANEARVFLAKNNLDRAENFSFGATRRDTLSLREVYVLIIGESSRYDRWQINGYGRETSPKLKSVDNLLTFTNAVAGAHYTWVSVPQIITRATPEDYDRQYREKSIVRVFQEAGFYTYWISNQSDQDIFWSGSITLHAKTADVSMFSPTYSPNLEFENVYDGRLLPILDSVLTKDKRSLFIVLHTMGNHWDYSRRYPAEFDVFKPSGYDEPISPPEAASREAFLNSYDNSILYADHFIHTVIRQVQAKAEVASVMFISDHGEDLYDMNADRPDFHFRPSASTLHVPLFLWTSAAYDSIFKEKRRFLERNLSKRIGAENIFYTLTDLANISITGYDETKSFASEKFSPSLQKFYDDDKRARLFSDLP